MITLLVALLVVVVIAAVVMVYVAYPGRGRVAGGPAGRVTQALGKAVGSVAPQPVDPPRHGLLGSASTDERMRRLVGSVESGVAAPFHAAGEMLGRAAEKVLTADEPSVPQNGDDTLSRTTGPAAPATEPRA